MKPPSAWLDQVRRRRRERAVLEAASKVLERALVTEVCRRIAEGGRPDLDGARLRSEARMFAAWEQAWGGKQVVRDDARVGTAFEDPGATDDVIAGGPRHECGPEDTE